MFIYTYIYTYIYLYEELARLAETRLAQNALDYLKLAYLALTQLKLPRTILYLALSNSLNYLASHFPTRGRRLC